MNKQDGKKSLTLKRQTVRALTAANLDDVHGGGKKSVSDGCVSTPTNCNYCRPAPSADCIYTYYGPCVPQSGQLICV